MSGENVRKERVSCNVVLLTQGACRQSMGWKRNHSHQVSEAINALWAMVQRQTPLAGVLRALYYASPSIAIKCTLEPPFSKS